MMGGGAPPAPPAPAPETKEIMCINALIAKDKSECLNEDPSHNLTNLLNASDAMILRSDCDEQLILNIYFVEQVKVHHLLLKQANPETAPKAICLYINRAPLDFDDTENVEADQGLELTDEELNGGETILDFVKYQSVSSLTIFIPENRSGGEVTELAQLEIYGTPINTANMKELKKVG